MDDLFVIDPATGLRQHRTAYIGVPRKNGKSTLGAALALYGLIMDKEPGAEVYSVAGDRTQASIVFHEARSMVEADPDLSARIRTYRYHLEDPETNSIYRVLSADAKLQQGLNPHWTIFDEVHVQPSEDLWNALALGSGTRRQPLLVGITTAGFDRTSLAWRLYQYGKRVLSGETVDPTFFFRWWEPADPACDHRDPAVWMETNPSYGTTLKPEAFVSDLALSESAFRRYRLNQWTTSAAGWLPHGAWEGRTDTARVVDPDEPVVLAFDGSWTNDSTAIVAATREARPHLWVIDLWEPSVTGETIDAQLVEDRLEEAMAAHHVVELVVDPSLWREQIARWTERGWPVVEFPNTLPRMIPATREFYAAATGDGLTHDGDPRLARHIANATTREDSRGVRLAKQARGQKIDAAVAAVMAFDRARVAAPPASRYESEGVFILGAR